MLKFALILIYALLALAKLSESDYKEGLVSTTKIGGFVYDVAQHHQISPHDVLSSMNVVDLDLTLEALAEVSSANNSHYENQALPAPSRQSSQEQPESPSRLGKSFACEGQYAAVTNTMMK